MLLHEWSGLNTCHDGEDHASERAAGGDDAEGCPALLEEPGRDGAHGGIEDGGCADRGADALGEKDLVVFGGKTEHHQAEDFQEGAYDEQPAWAVVVVEFAFHAIKIGTLGMFGRV